MRPDAPTLAGELKRGFNGFNLAVGAFTSLGAGVLGWVGAEQGLLTGFTIPEIAGAALLLFLAITALHAGAHAYMGWRLQRGVAAHDAGRYGEAIRLLAIVARRGMDHYDIHGVARQCLEAARLQGDSGASAGRRSNPL